MSYQVLSRKWRPQRFDEVIGQTHVTRTLLNAINMDRVGHGYIFSGPRGVGKTTTARILAKVLNCPEIQDGNPCGNCVSCTEITQSRSMDVLEMDGASNRGIDEIRDLREAVKYPPNSGKYRIYIIDEVHMLTREAFNALLKTLEEPPPHAIFIMATTDPHKIPATILSRTQRFDFKPISVDDIAAYLKFILNKESITFEEDGLSLIAQKAGGSLRDSLSLLDQVIAYSQDGLTVESIRDVLGVIREAVFLEILQAISKGAVGELIQSLNLLMDSGSAVTDLISGLNEYLRNCMVYSAGAISSSKLTEATTSWMNTKNSFSTKDFLRMLDLTLQFESKLKYIQQPRISMEALFIKLASMDRSVEISAILSGKAPEKFRVRKPAENKVSEPTASETKPMLEPSSPEQPKTAAVIESEEPVEKKTDEIKQSSVTTKTEDAPIQPEQGTGKPSSTMEIQPVEKGPEQVKNVSLEDIQSRWHEVLESLEIKNSKIAHFLDEAVIKSFDGTTIKIDLVNGHRFHLKTLEKDVSGIEAVLSDVFNQKIRVNFHLKENSEQQNSEKKQAGDTEHPLFMQVLETFEGEIIR